MHQGSFISKFDSLKSDELLIHEVVSGSNAYGLATVQSDVDIKGVFLPTKKSFYSSRFVEQINDESNDHVYFEVGKFFRLLQKSNPSILEILGVEQEHRLKSHPEITRLNHEKILSKQCEDTFLGYALSQIRRARKVRSRILLDEHSREKTAIDFCRVLDNGQLIYLSDFAQSHGIGENELAVVGIDSTLELYHLCNGGKGIKRDIQSGHLEMQSGVDQEPIAILHYDSKGHKQYIKDFSGYWEWLRSKTAETPKDASFVYDSKNMMHVFRLLLTAKDIATKQELKVYRPEREFLLQIRQSEIPFDELIPKMESLIVEVREAFAKSKLPDAPDAQYLNERLVSIRSEHYS